MFDLILKLQNDSPWQNILHHSHFSRISPSTTGLSKEQTPRKL
jgi:hypothetical protein